MELEKILNNYLEGKEIIKENNDMNSLNNNLDDEDLYEEDEDLEDQDSYEDGEEDYDDEEDDEEYGDDDFEEVDIETITDLEKMKIVCDILNHIENDYPGLEKIITILQDIIEDNQYQ